MLDLDRRKPGSWTPPGQRVTASLSGGPVTARRAGTARVTSLEQVLRQRRHIGALPGRDYGAPRRGYGYGPR